ncbi:MAG: LamG-like jellyroll fold domain-containing protein, partial [Bacteroidota bacterium]|nr:LamG-like jellyroll fold domain-containing protein [Bacteroidota bacterium]
SYFFTPRGSITPGQWHHIALAVNGPEGFAELYIDGELSIRPTFTPRSFDARTGLAIGGYYANAGGSYLRGAIDEVRLWTYVRSETQIRQHMNGRLSLDARERLTGYWSFCGNFADSSGFGNDLTAIAVSRPETVTGLPPALSCDALPADTASITWSAADFPTDPCRMDSTTLAPVIVVNAAETPQLLQRVTLSGTHAADFSVVTDPTPALLMPGDSLRITCGFRAGDHGAREALLLLVFPDTTLQVPLLAAYRGPMVEISGLPLHFRSVDGAAVTQDIVLRNLSSRNSATVSDVIFTPQASLSVDTPLPLTIAPASSRIVRVRYAPENAGATEATVALIIDGCATESTVTGDACPAMQFGTLDIPAVTGTPGDTIWVPLRVRQWDSFFRVEGAVLFGSLEIDCHALFPLFADGGLWDSGARRVAVETTLEGGSDTVAVLPFLVLLGTDSSCVLEWTVDSVQAGCPLTITGESSVAAVTGFCQEGDTRLFDGSRQLVLQAPHPSPGNGVVQLRFSTIESGLTTLTVYDVRGRAVRRIVRETLPPGEYRHELDTAQLPSGVYLLQLSTPRQLRTRRFIVVK